MARKARNTGEGPGLVITRQDGDGFWVGPDVHITVKEIRGYKVRLKIEAPPDRAIFRDELVEKVGDRLMQRATNG